LCSVLPYRIPGYDISAKSLWLHSVATGVLCERLASALRIKPPDLLFTAGLLHDIGKLVVGALLVGQSERILQEINNNGTTFFKAEQTLLDTDHAEIGALLCETWALPPALAWTARWHHSPNEAVEHASERLDLTLIDLVHLADGLAHTLGFGADIGALSRTIENETMDRLLVDKQSIDQTVSETVINCIWEMGDMVAGGISC
jgi:putative nucleotidyltransferase with HDIG domain